MCHASLRASWPAGKLTCSLPTAVLEGGRFGTRPQPHRERGLSDTGWAKEDGVLAGLHELAGCEDLDLLLVERRLIAEVEASRVFTKGKRARLVRMAMYFLVFDATSSTRTASSDGLNRMCGAYAR